MKLPRIAIIFLSLHLAIFAVIGLAAMIFAFAAKDQAKATDRVAREISKAEFEMVRAFNSKNFYRD